LLIARIAELFASDAGDDSLENWNSIGRQVELASRTLRSLAPQLVVQVRAKVDAYYAELQRLGMRDSQLRARPAKSPWRWLERIAIAPLAIPGFALYAIPYFIPRLVARSSDPDAVSTIKLGTALVVYPVWAAGLVWLSFIALPPPLSFVAAGVALASPFAALRWLDAWWGRQPDRVATSDELAVLARLRIAARTAIDDARAKLA
jgi:hypothetical protein